MSPTKAAVRGGTPRTTRSSLVNQFAGYSAAMARAPTPAPATFPSAGSLINGQFRVEIARPLPGAGGGLPAFAVTDVRDGQTGLMAVQVRRHLPVRDQALQILSGVSVDGLLTPLAYGAAPAQGGEEAGFLICHAPPGPALSATLRVWPEAELLTLLLRPIARVLDQLAQRGLSHRGIRLDNVFRAGLGHPVTLGCAWATPPAALQPAVAEPPYVAICRPGSRGDGTVADDVYALGVLMLTLALGRAPLAGVDEAEIIRQKLDQGSHAVLLGEQRVGHFVGDLLRGMLAEDPEHRPPPSLLLDPATARSRRTAARPPQRAPRPIEVGNVVCWHARMLANALATQPELGLRALKTGAIGQWLRRSLGDGALAVRLDEQLGFRAAGNTPGVRGEGARGDGANGEGGGETGAEAGGENNLSLMRAVATLDQLAPMCWNGLNLWPDAIGTTLAEAMQDPAAPANAEIAGRVAGLVGGEAQTAWARLRPDRADSKRLRMDVRQVQALLHLPGAVGGLARMTYQLNPLLPCMGAGLDGRWVVRLGDLMPALEATARRDRALARPISAGIAAFIAARGDRGLEPLVSRLGDLTGTADPLAQLRLLAQMQARYHPKPLPALGAWIAERVETLLGKWHSRPRRAELRPQLRELAASGQLSALLALLDDPQAHRSDDDEVQQAARDLARIDAALAMLAAGGPARGEQARRLGQEVAAGLGLSALALMLVIAAFG
jgi:hypothetical protein